MSTRVILYHGVTWIGVQVYYLNTRWGSPREYIETRLKTTPRNGNNAPLYHYNMSANTLPIYNNVLCPTYIYWLLIIILYFLRPLKCAVSFEGFRSVRIKASGHFFFFFFGLWLNFFSRRRLAVEKRSTLIAHKCPQLTDDLSQRKLKRTGHFNITYRKRIANKTMFVCKRKKRP